MSHEHKNIRNGEKNPRLQQGQKIDLKTNWVDSSIPHASHRCLFFGFNIKLVTLKKKKDLNEIPNHPHVIHSK